MPVATELAHRAQTTPHAPALVVGDRRWSAGELSAAVSGAAAVLRAVRMGPGDVVALLVDDPALSLIWLLAVDAVAGTAAMLDPHWPSRSTQAALVAVAPGVLIAPHDATGVPVRLDPHDIPDPAEPLTAVRDGSLVTWIGFTSGSSGGPRAVARTRESWTASFPAFSELTGITAADDVLIPGPLTSSLFCFGAMHALAVGATVRLLPRWNAVTAGYTAVHLVPAMLRELLDRRPVQATPRVIVCAGAKLPPEWEADAHATLPQTGLVEYYGSTEQSFVSLRIGGDARTVGTPFPGVDVQIRDGEIWSRSPYTCQGYVGPTAGPLRRDGDWTTVGDRGLLDPTGALVVTGRGDAVIVTGGASVIAGDVEAVLHAAPGVGLAVVLGSPHPRFGATVTAVIEPRAGGCSLAEVREYVRAHLPRAQRPQRWYVVDRLPRTASGKPARAEVAAALRDGSLVPRPQHPAVG